MKLSFEFADRLDFHFKTFIATRRKARFARLPLDWAENIGFCSKSQKCHFRWFMQQRTIISYCGRRAHIELIAILGK